jgi:autotransporter strand-loop-strand O-heptosyltransferase
MRIVNVTPGLLPIPPNGWGAVEKIIWEYHNNFIRKGHISEIKYLNDIKPNEYDIIHIHVGNLANMANERGLPYYFTLHDHHAYLYGKDSNVFKENYKAMKNAIKAFVPAKYLVDYFNLPNVEYMPHGVNTELFINKEKPKQHKLLCLANNGYQNNKFYDRKGFLLAIHTARLLDLPITIAGPKSNVDFLNHHNVKYDKLTVLTDLTEDELIECYNNHTIFLHPSELEAGHPNLTLLEAISCGLPIVGTLEDNNELKGMIKCKREVNDIYDKVKYVIDNYEQLSKEAYNESRKRSWDKMTNKLIEKYNNEFYTSENMKNDLIDVYENTEIRRIEPKEKFKVIIDLKDGLYFDIVSGKENEVYNVKFINDDTGQVIYETNIKEKHYAKPSIKYYINWKVEVRDSEGNLIYEYNLDLENKNVLLKFESSSIGDTIAWFPYVEDFRKKHNCNVYVSTFHNNLFKDNYPNIKFVEPGSQISVDAIYRLGIYYDNNGINRFLNKSDYRYVPLQKVGSDILGVEYIEKKPNISIEDTKNPFPSKKVAAIAINSTAQAKYWNNPNGWQKVVDYLNALNYKVILLSKEEDGYMGNKYPQNVHKVVTKNVKEVVNYLKYSDLFIGIGSGISWLAWAINCPTILISGFSKPYAEFSGKYVYRIHNNNVCNGCFNRHLFDKGDWNWCPDKKGTNEQFICSTSIPAEKVIDRIDQYIQGFENKEFPKFVETLQGKLPLYDYDFPNTMDKSIEKYGEVGGVWFGAFINKELEKHNFSIEEGDIFVDLGANIGASSMYALEKGASEVHCYEPDPKLTEIIRKNIPYANIYNSAIGSDFKTEKFYHWAFNDVVKGHKYDANIIPLELVLDTHRKIDYLKVDIEGYEEEAFVNTHKDKFKNVKKMFIEHHDSSKIENFINIIKSKGFNVEVDTGSNQSYIYATNNIYDIIRDSLSDKKSINNTNIINRKKEIYIISTYPNTSIKDEITQKCINSIKKHNNKVILSSHIPVSISLQKNSDFYIYDSYNPLFGHSLYTKSWYENNLFRVDCNYSLDDMKNNNQSLTVLNNIYNSVKLAKSFGYDRIISVTYDSIFTDNDMNKINEICENIDKHSKEGFFMQFKDNNNDCLKSVFFIVNVDFFLNIFNNIRTPKMFNEDCVKVKSHNFLEHYFYKKLENFKEKIIIEETNEDILFEGEMNIFSEAEYLKLLPIENNDNSFMIWFTTNNKYDKRKLSIDISKGGNVIKNISKNINSKTIFYEKIDLSFNDNIDLKIELLDSVNGNVIKSENHQGINLNNFKDKLKNNGLFKFK